MASNPHHPDDEAHTQARQPLQITGQNQPASDAMAEAISASTRARLSVSGGLASHPAAAHSPTPARPRNAFTGSSDDGGPPTVAASGISGSTPPKETFEERVKRQKREERAVDRKEKKEREDAVKAEKAMKARETPVERKDRWGKKSQAEMAKRVEAREVRREIERAEAQKEARAWAREKARKADRGEAIGESERGQGLFLGSTDNEGEEADDEME